MRLQMELMVYKACRLGKYCKHDCSGQSTVEFAVVMGAVLAIIICLGVLLNFTDGGVLVEHAVASASHNISGAMIGIAGDLFCV